jgi:hypothetical protein
VAPLAALAGAGVLRDRRALGDEPVFVEALGDRRAVRVGEGEAPDASRFEIDGRVELEPQAAVGGRPRVEHVVVLQPLADGDDAAVAGHELGGRERVPEDGLAPSRRDDVHDAVFHGHRRDRHGIREDAASDLDAGVRVEDVDDRVLPPRRVGVARHHGGDDDGRARNAHLIDAAPVLGTPRPDDGRPRPIDLGGHRARSASVAPTVRPVAENDRGHPRDDIPDRRPLRARPAIQPRLRSLRSAIPPGPRYLPDRDTSRTDRCRRTGEVSTDRAYSTVTVFARLRGWSTSVPFRSAT